jgi:hypothetical protein
VSVPLSPHRIGTGLLRLPEVADALHTYFPGFFPPPLVEVLFHTVMELAEEQGVEGSGKLGWTLPIFLKVCVCVCMWEVFVARSCWLCVVWLVGLLCRWCQGLGWAPSRCPVPYVSSTAWCLCVLGNAVHSDSVPSVLLRLTGDMRVDRYIGWSPSHLL